MFERLPIALSRKKHVTHAKMYLMKSDKSYVLCFEQNKPLKTYITM